MTDFPFAPSTTRAPDQVTPPEIGPQTPGGPSGGGDGGVGSTPALNLGLSAFCADYEAWIIKRGDPLAPLGLLTGWSTLTWQRVRNGVSAATVKFDNVLGLTPECCRVLQYVRPWAVELSIRRSGLGEVWVGPVMMRPVQGGSLTITAYDLGKWLDRRRIHRGYKIVQQEARDVYETLWHDAIDVENGMGLQLVRRGKTGVLVDFSQDDGLSNQQQASGALQQLVSSAVDVVTVGRYTYMGSPDTTLMDAQLLDNGIVGIPDHDDTGEQMANDLIVIGASKGGAGRAPAARALASSDYRARDGLLERVDTDQSLQSPAEVNAASQQRIQLYADAPATISSARLAPRAPFALDNLIPGRLIDVRLTDACMQIIGVYRLQELNGSAEASAEGGGEIVNLTLQYEAPTIDLMPTYEVTGL